MTKCHLVVRLDILDEVVLSERAATAGGHRSLDYLPGGVLLGAIAARLYGDLLARNQEFTIFHSGKIRFGNGIPLALDRNEHRGTPAWPIPKSIHRPKGDDESALSDSAVNLVLPDRDSDADTTQMQQWRDGYVTADLRLVAPRRNYAMKTAIDSRRGRAQEQQLYGYESLVAGQSFVATIEADDDAEMAFQPIREFFREPSVLRLGRSRSAEFGRARVTPLERPPIRPPAQPAREDSLSIWALSDLSLFDEHGRPVLSPIPRLFGFPEAEIDWQRTFVRTRRYSPFNSHWGYYGLERAVITQGSVITLTGAGLNDKGAHAQLARGIGHFREAGLGRVSVNPWILAEKKLASAKVEWVPLPTDVTGAPPEASPLLDWLRERQRSTSSGEARAQFVAGKLRELNANYQAAAIWVTGSQEAIVGPGVSQWNAVREVAERADGDAKKLERGLFEDAKAVARAEDGIWSIRFDADHGARTATFHGWLSDLVEELEGQQDGLSRVLPEIAKQAAEQFRKRSRQ